MSQHYGVGSTGRSFTGLSLTLTNPQCNSPVNFFTPKPLIFEPVSGILLGVVLDRFADALIFEEENDDA
jgi:hypothetical protein